MEFKSLGTPNWPLVDTSSLFRVGGTKLMQIRLMYILKNMV